MLSPDDGYKQQREYAWSYFQLHANQRMSTFNFFIIVAALLTTALTTALPMASPCPFLGIVLGSSLMIAAFAFWMLDKRVRFLIKHAETSLKSIEKEWSNTGCANAQHVALFSAEEEMTRALRRSQALWPGTWQMSYSHCFGLVYLLFGGVGLVGLLLAILL